MQLTTISSREFNHNTSKAKRNALNGPVIITDRNHPSHVLLSIKDYQNITEQKESIINLLSMPSSTDIEFNPEKLSAPLYQPVDLS